MLARAVFRLVDSRWGVSAVMPLTAFGEAHFAGISNLQSTKLPRDISNFDEVRLMFLGDWLHQSTGHIVKRLEFFGS